MNTPETKRVSVKRKLARLRAKRELAQERIALARLEKQAKAEELRAANYWPRAMQRNPGSELMQESFTGKRDLFLEVMEARRAGKDLTEASFLWDWVSGYADLIDRMRGPDGLLLTAISIAADRQYGSYWPFFRTWNDLALLRGASRILYQTSALARGAVNAVASYIVGTGFTVRVVKKEGCPPALRLAAQEILDENSDLNNWPQLERDCVMRDSRDGEWYLRDFADDDGTTRTRWVEPEQLIQPGDSTLKEWSFGKQNPVDPYDVETTVAYNVCYDGNNTTGDIVSADSMIAHCNNVDNTVKRGIPDLSYDVYDFLKVAGRLIGNLGTSAAVQASVAEILQYDGPVTSDLASEFATTDATYQETNPWDGSSTNVRVAKAGESRQIPKGQTYVSPPWSQGTPTFIQAEQAILRAVAVCWNAPEWLTSGDSSNNNYASSLTAESPFVKTGSYRQQIVYKPLFRTVRWRVLRNYCAAKGGIVAAGVKYSWADVQKYLDLQCEAPSMEVREKGDEASANSVRVQGGWKSRQTVAQEEGLDWETEKRNIEQYNEEMGPAELPLPMPGDGQTQQGSDAQPPSLESVLLENGFTGVDSHGHKWVDGKQVPIGGEKKNAKDSHAETVAKMQADHQSALAAHGKRVESRNTKRESLSTTRVESPLAKTRDSAVAALNDLHKTGGGEDLAKATEAVHAQVAGALEGATAALKSHGASDADLASLHKNAEKLQASLERKAAAYRARMVKVANAKNEYAVLEKAEPSTDIPDPTLPDEPDFGDYEQSPAGEAKYDADYAAYEKETEKIQAAYDKDQEKADAIHDKWESKLEVAGERLDAAQEKLDESHDAWVEELDDGMAELDEKADEVLDRLEERLDAEDEEDEEPEEPDYPEEPEEPDYPEEPEEEGIDDASAQAH